MRWKELKTAEQFSRLLQDSENFPVVIFKHSTRCATSSVALSRIERDWNDDAGEIQFYYLDVIAHRELSRQIADSLGITHQSPQLMVIKGKKSIYDASHLFISLSDAVNRMREEAA